MPWRTDNKDFRPYLKQVLFSRSTAVFSVRPREAGVDRKEPELHESKNRMDFSAVTFRRSSRICFLEMPC